MTSESGWEQTRDEVQRSENRWFRWALGLHQFYLIALLHALMIGVMSLSSALDVQPWWVTATCATVLAFSDIIFYVVLKSGYNLRFRNPSLILPRMLVVIVVMLFSQIYAGPTKGCCALVIVTTFVLAGSHASLRSMLRVNLLTVIAYGATIPLMQMAEGSHFNLRAECLNWLSFSNTLSAAVLAGATISTLRRRLAESNARLGDSLNTVTALATTDELTKVYNRRYIEEMMENEVQRVSRGGASFSVCLLDIDYFKRINDSYGHQAGDAVLKAFAGLVDGSRRGGDIFARWGGEEFILFLPQSALGTARSSAERIRSAVRDLRVAELPSGSGISVSIGIAEASPGESLLALIERADQALYRAKQGGRDRVESMPPIAITSSQPEPARMAF